MRDNSTQNDCRLRWEALKERGDFTVAEIEAIDNDTPWSEVEPRWWLGMMDEKRKLMDRPPVIHLPPGTAHGLERETVGDLIYRQHGGGGPKAS